MSSEEGKSRTTQVFELLAPPTRLTRREIAGQLGLNPDIPKDLQIVSYTLGSLAKHKIVETIDGKWGRMPGAELTQRMTKTSGGSRAPGVPSFEKKIQQGETLMNELIKWWVEVKPLIITPAEKQELEDLRAYRDSMEEQIRNLAPPKMRRKT